MKVIDLSHTIKNDMQIYPGDPAPTIERSLEHDKDYCHVDRLNLGSHTGTHIDAPYHFLKDGKRISDFTAGYFVGRGIVIDVRGMEENEAITLDQVKAYDKDIEKGMFVFLMTGWDKYFGQEKYLKHPFLSEDAAKYFLDKGVQIVGLDALNIDSTQDEVFASHNVLLPSDVLIVENLCKLDTIPEAKDAIYSLLPLKVEGTDGSPVRAVCIITD